MKDSDEILMKHCLNGPVRKTTDGKGKEFSFLRNIKTPGQGVGEGRTTSSISSHLALRDFHFCHLIM